MGRLTTIKALGGQRVILYVATRGRHNSCSITVVEKQDIFVLLTHGLYARMIIYFFMIMNLLCQCFEIMNA